MNDRVVIEEGEGPPEAEDRSGPLGPSFSRSRPSCTGSRPWDSRTSPMALPASVVRGPNRQHRILSSSARAAPRRPRGSSRPGASRRNSSPGTAWKNS